MGEMQEEKKGGKGSEKEEKGDGKIDNGLEVSARMIDGATGNGHADLPAKRGRGRPKKETVTGKSASASARKAVGKIDRYLSKGGALYGCTSEGFVTKSKLSHTPIKKKQNKDEEKEGGSEEAKKYLEDGVIERKKTDNEKGEFVGDDGGSKEGEDGSASLSQNDEANMALNRMRGSGNSKKGRHDGEDRESVDEGVDDPNEWEEVDTDGGSEVGTEEIFDDGASGFSEREEAGHDDGKHWFVEIRKAEARLRREMGYHLEEFEKRMKLGWNKERKRINEESEGQMKQWFREEAMKINDECEAESYKHCEKCEENRKERSELQKRVRELRESADQEKKQWEEERRRLLNIINGAENKEGRKEPEETRKRGRKGDGNCSFDSISEASLMIPAGRVTDVGGKASREEKSLKKIMERKPRPLNERDLKEEKGKREYRKNNISIYFPDVKGKSKDRILNEISEKCGQDIRGKTMIKYENGGLVVVRYKDWNEKREMMNRRWKLKGTDIWIKNDMTKREKDVQKWLWEIAENEKRLGRRAEVSYMKINFGDDWWRWNDRRGNIELQRYEGKERQYVRDVQQPFRIGRRQ